MKNLLITTAFVVASAGAAFAQDTDMVTVQGEMERGQLTRLVDQMLTTYNMEVDVGSLTDEQLSELYLLRASSEEGGLGADDAVEQRINEILSAPDDE